MNPFLRREAVLSSRIEGTEASISDLFLFEESANIPSLPPDTREVMNYISALEYGRTRLDALPISTRLMNEIHEVLLTGVRGENKMPGQLRTSQVYIGREGAPIEQARYIPPPAEYVRDLMYDLEQFANDDTIEMPPLVKCAVMHYQFEAIHPYMDGNGRVGRLLIMLQLCADGVMSTPLLYLSAYFERNRDAYYDHLLEVSATGQWEPWLAYFLDGVAEQATDAVRRSRNVRDLQEAYRDLLQGERATANSFRLLDQLFVNPYLTVTSAANVLGVTRAAASRTLQRFTELGILELLPGKWRRYYVARRLLDAIEAPTAEATS
jgi:Fic family protein